MPVSLVEILKMAEANQTAVGAFNTPNLECINAVLEAAEELNVPVILSHAELHEPVSGLSVIGPVMVAAAKTAKVPVCVHLDHCETLDYMRQALEIGFTGVMYDHVNGFLGLKNTALIFKSSSEIFLDFFNESIL